MREPMTDQHLADVKRRAAAAAEDLHEHGATELVTQLVTTDVPALIAEVVRLRGEDQDQEAMAAKMREVLAKHEGKVFLSRETEKVIARIIEEAKGVDVGEDYADTLAIAVKAMVEPRGRRGWTLGVSAEELDALIEQNRHVGYVGQFVKDYADRTEVRISRNGNIITTVVIPRSPQTNKVECTRVLKAHGIDPVMVTWIGQYADEWQ